MKKIQLLAALLIAVIAISCGKKKESKDIIVPTVEVVKPKAPISMQPYNQQQEVKWLDKSYQVFIDRVADDSLRMVQDETGQKFVDNRITLRVIRADGSVFFKKVFTKSSFDAQLDDDYRQTGILEGLVFDKVDGNNLIFAGSVSHPQTDEYIPLVVTVSNFGNVTIKRDDQMDTNSTQEQQPQENQVTDEDGGPVLTATVKIWAAWPERTPRGAFSITIASFGWRLPAFWSPIR